MSSPEQFTRIVSLVAELTRAERRGEPSATLAGLARTHGVSAREIAADVRTLTLLGEHADADWLLSLSVWQQEDRISISSGGPFRRPVRLSPEEQLAIQVALAADPEGAPLARRFAKLAIGEPEPPRGRPEGPIPTRPSQATDRERLVSRAAREHRELTVEYAGEGEPEAREWRLEPHQVAAYRDRVYLIAWATDLGAWRHFRLDRCLRIEVGERRFSPRADFRPVERPEDLFRPGEETDVVTVRFGPGAAPLAADRYPDHQTEPDGSILVRFRTASPDWLVRRVLEYGPDAEVLGPARYREALRRAVA